MTTKARHSLDSSVQRLEFFVNKFNKLSQGLSERPDAMGSIQEVQVWDDIESSLNGAYQNAWEVLCFSDNSISDWCDYSIPLEMSVRSYDFVKSLVDSGWFKSECASSFGSMEELAREEGIEPDKYAQEFAEEILDSLDRAMPEHPQRLDKVKRVAAWEATQANDDDQHKEYIEGTDPNPFYDRHETSAGLRDKPLFYPSSGQSKHGHRSVAARNFFVEYLSIDAGICPIQFTLMARLLFKSNRYGYVKYGKPTLAKDCNVTKKTVIKHIKRLVEIGMLEIVREGYRNSRGDNLPTEYRVTLAHNDATDETLAMRINALRGNAKFRNVI